MDNDFITKKMIGRIYREFKFKFDYSNVRISTESEGNSIIKQHLINGQPLMVARFGANEMRCVHKWMLGLEYNKKDMERSLYAAGIFPSNKDTIDEFCKIYTNAIRSIDILGVWETAGEKMAIKRYCPKAKLIQFTSIEPYFFDDPWSSALSNKKVLIVHPFIDSIKSQLKNREKIWPGKNVLPEFSSVDYVKAVQSNAGAVTNYKNWFEALKFMEDEISNKDFDVAIIGAGAYGLPLADYVKKIGKQAIQMCGSTQILFGIKGKRWDNSKYISGFYNEFWTRPLDNETPPESTKVEGGSYW